MTFVIIHFNTPELTTCLCASFRKYHPNDNLLIFDNSDNKPFTNADIFNAKYMDNTAGQIINFEQVFSNYNIDSMVWKINKLGSAKHAYTIDWILHNINDTEICLLDSDILLKKKIDFCDNTYTSCGELNTEEIKYRKRPARILPYIQYININEIKKANISFFNHKKIMGFDIKARPFDTGCSFFKDINDLHKKVKTDILLDDYMIHFKGGSWAKTDHKVWLMKNIDLWK